MSSEHNNQMDAQQSGSQAEAARPVSPQGHASQKKHTRWLWVIVASLCPLLPAPVVLSRAQSRAGAAPNARRMTGPVPVTTATAKQESITVHLSAIGTVTPVYTDRITAQVTGVIKPFTTAKGRSFEKAIR